CLTNNSSTSKLLIVAMMIISVIYKNNRDNTRVDNYLRNNAFPSMIQAFTASNPFSRILTVRN
ncbi:TPA: hypothetical protein ACH9QJ_001793, partial [Escherichia coli]